MSFDTEHSSYREKLIEHLFVGEVLRFLWLRGVADVEVLKPEVDNGGWDVAFCRGPVTRHVQLKSSAVGSTTSQQNVHMRLAEKASGCVVWLVFDPKLQFKSFLWYGGEPGEPLPDISRLPVAKHARANAKGDKAYRPQVRVLRRGVFTKLARVDALVERLIGRCWAES